jgi:NitT/TauT family transport system permease protein
VRRALLGAAPVLGVVAFFGVWEAMVRLRDVATYVLPAPSRIVGEIADRPGFYWDQSVPTMREAAIGFALALLAALPLGTVMALSRFAEQATWPLLVLVQVTPVVAYAPAMVVWFGFGSTPILVVTVLVCVVPLVLATVTGLRSVDPAALELLRSVHASRREEFVTLRLPSALPHLFTGARVSVSLALVGALLGELFAGVTEGLGYTIRRAQASLIANVLPLWACVFVLAVIGTTAFALLAGLERVLLRWHSSQQF